MKRNAFFRRLLLSASLLAPMGASAQVTIGSDALPQATLDVVASKTDGSTAEGIIAPRLTLTQLKAADAQYLAAQTGTVVYVTDATGATTAKTANVTAAGYYYFDGTVWQKMGGGAVGLTTEVDGIIGNEVTNATDATLVRSGSGTAAAPYTLARAALSGDVTVAAGSNTTAIGAGRVTSAMIADGTIVAADMSDAAITANNGLTENTKNNIQLGGTLVQNTTINQSSYSLTHSGTGKTIISTPLQYNNSGASAGAGKVLTSDASGNATWKNTTLTILQSRNPQPTTPKSVLIKDYPTGSWFRDTDDYIDLAPGKYMIITYMPIWVNFSLAALESLDYQMGLMKAGGSLSGITIKIHGPFRGANDNSAFDKHMAIFTLDTSSDATTTRYYVGYGGFIYWNASGTIVTTTHSNAATNRVYFIRSGISGYVYAIPMTQ